MKTLMVHDYAYKGYLIRELRAGGYCIVRDGHCIQHFVASIAAARALIDLLG